MKRFFTLISLLALGSFINSSCTKKCTAEDVYIGDAIVHEVNGNPVILYPESGYMTSNMGGNYLINGNHTDADKFEVSFDKGYSRQPVDYTKYTILANPKITPCNGAFERKLEINYMNQVVTYTATPVSDCAEQCEGEGYSMENYILVDKSQLPASFLLQTK